MKKLYNVFLILIFATFAISNGFSDDFYIENPPSEDASLPKEKSSLISQKIKVNEYILQNGMNVFIVEDFSSPLVRIEYTSKAGFSKQNPKNAGFFPLYTRLFKYSVPWEKDLLNQMQSECNADSSRYIFTVSNDEFIYALETLSSAVFNPVFSNDDLEKELSQLKKEVTNNAFSIEGFINSSIDSRVFSQSPWKHDSGIYPSVFSKTSISEARVFLENIKNNFYTPENSALFISGPVEKNVMLKSVEKYFNYIPKTKKVNHFYEEEKELLNTTLPKTKKFVLTDPEFSPDMTQIVVQYTNLSMEQSDYAAAILDRNDSVLKEALLNQGQLKISSPEYINAQSTHKNGSSRLIIQSLLENKNLSPVKSSMNFVSTVESSIDLISQEDFEKGKKLLVNNFTSSIENSSQLMNLLSQFWAVDDYKVERQNSEYLFDSFMSRPDKLESLNVDELKNKMKEDEPFVFILINSKNLEKYKKQFLSQGFEIVTVKNGSWYTSQLYNNLRQSIEETSTIELTSEIENKDYFIEKSKSFLSNFSLDNNINVLTFKKEISNTVCFSLVLKGGQSIDNKKDYGLEAVLINLLSVNLQNLLYEKYSQNMLKTFPKVFEQIDFKNSILSVECLSEDLPLVIESFAESLIFSDVIPAIVDSIVMEQKSNQIVKTSSTTYQLYSAAINSLIKNKEYSTVYSMNKDILKKISYTDVLVAYQNLLNAAKYSILICGNYSCFKDELELKNCLNHNFGLLIPEKEIPDFDVELKESPKNVKKVKLTHLFLTDVSREKAGPRPLVLIPTKEFLDPAQFWIKCNDNNVSQFNSVLLDFASIVEKKCNEVLQEQKMIVKTQLATNDLPFGIITVLNVKNISTVESIYNEAYEEYLGIVSKERLLKIKSLWKKNYYNNSMTNFGMTLLLCKNIFNQKDFKTELFSEYEKVLNLQIEDVQKIILDFEFENTYKFYSQDTKK